MNDFLGNKIWEGSFVVCATINKQSRGNHKLRAGRVLRITDNGNISVKGPVAERFVAKPHRTIVIPDKLLNHDLYYEIMRDM